MRNIILAFATLSLFACSSGVKQKEARINKERKSVNCKQKNNLFDVSIRNNRISLKALKDIEGFEVRKVRGIDTVSVKSVDIVSTKASLNKGEVVYIDIRFSETEGKGYISTDFTYRELGQQKSGSSIITVGSLSKEQKEDRSKNIKSLSSGENKDGTGAKKQERKAHVMKL